MRGRLVLAVAVLAVGLVSGPPAAVAAENPATVTADAETSPVPLSGDAADDPAIWVHPDDPASSLIIGNDKKGGLETYTLDGARHQRITTATTFWGNVDVRQGVTVAGQRRDVIAAYNAGLRFYDVNATSLDLRARTDGTGVVGTGGGEGLCLYDSPTTGNVSAFVITRAGRVRQYQLTDSDGDGLLLASMTREFQVGSEAEGCLADDDTGALYISEEDVGLWRYGAEPGAGTSRSMVDPVTPAGHIAPDAEGVALVDQPTGPDYLLVSAQNGSDPSRNYYVAYDRATNDYVGSFKVATGTSADGCQRTDGIAASTADLGPRFPHGMFICQDNTNTTPGSGNQNFKMVALEKITALWAPAGNQAPTASFTVGCTQLTCSFDASASVDADGTLEDFSWDFGDGGATGSGETVEHPYAQAGSYTVRLTVTDDDGATGTTTRSANPSETTSTVSFVAAASTNGNRTAHTVVIPPSVAPGDTLLLFFADNGGSAVTAPTGWTSLEAVGDSGATGRLWTRTVDPSDAGSTVTVRTGALAKSDLTVTAYRGAATPATAASSAALDVVVPTTHVTPLVGTSGDNWVVSYWGDKSSDGTVLTTPPSQVRRASSNGTGGGHITAVMTDSGAALAAGQVGGVAATGTANSGRTVKMTVALTTP